MVYCYLKISGPFGKEVGDLRVLFKEVTISSEANNEIKVEKMIKRFQERLVIGEELVSLRKII